MRVKLLSCLAAEDFGDGRDIAWACWLQVGEKTVVVELLRIGPWEGWSRDDWCNQFGYQAACMLRDSQEDFPERATIMVHSDQRVVLCEPRTSEPGSVPQQIAALGRLTLTEPD